MNIKRMRGRNHRPNGGGGGGSGFRNQQNGIPLNRNHVFDSSGPEMRVRGTAQQLFEKYQQLARDASSNGDRVLGEAYHQHAEHYFRIISAINQAQGQPSGQPSGQPNGQPNGQPYAPPNGQNTNQPHPQQGNQERGYNQNNGEYNRRPEPNTGDASADQQAEGRYEQRPQENRAQENRAQENRQEPRRFEQRPYEQRNNEQRNKPDYQPRHERHERNERYRPETPLAASPIDISSALEAELAATVGAMAEPTGFGHQPVLSQAVLSQPVAGPSMISQAAPVEARAIPIIPDAPPQPAVVAATTPETLPVKVARPRGRPRVVKPAAGGLKLEG